MSAPAKQHINRNTERIFLLLLSAVMAVLFYKMYLVINAGFKEVPDRLKNGTMINLNDVHYAGNMKTLLQKGRYFSDEKDINLISSTFEKTRLADSASIDNIGDLNKKQYSVLAETALSQGGETFKRRVQGERIALGITDEETALFALQQKDRSAVSSVNDLHAGSHSISGSIHEAGIAVPNVIVRLQLILPQDSLYSNNVEEVDSMLQQNTTTVKKLYAVDSLNNKQLQSLTAYAQTDAHGNFVFKNLPGDKTYKILPLQLNYAFGYSQGIEKLDHDASFNFYRSPHRLKLFSTKDFSSLKKEKAFIVRTPDEVMQWFWIISISFIAGFLLLHVVMSLWFKNADQLILPAIMVITGLSFITLFSLQDPLRDWFLAKNTIGYFIAGIVGIILLLLFDLKRFTTDSKLYRLFVFSKMKLASNGWPWAVIASGLLAMTLLFGTGPEGSGVKVNLFGFQPSEIVKFVIVFFLAGFFATNEKFISSYFTWTKRSRFFAFALIAILATIFLFLMLGDLGPAMVCCFAFIILFSFSRGDFAHMAISVLFYVLAVWLLDNVLTATAVTAVFFVIYTLVVTKKISESSVMALVVIAAFLLLDKIPLIAEYFPGPMERLIDRKAIWQDPWNNEVFGGDQIANGIWAMSGGGITGQGAGEGFAKTIPEAHTDMILPAMGEEFGLAGIISVFIVFFIYLHRSIVIGRHSGRPFLFYICAGIGIATFVQFLLIAGGSVGALPLSGVALPFMSYGGSSLIANMLAAGFLLSASTVQGSPVQMKFISQQQDRNLMPALIAACAAIILLGVSVTKYILGNAKWIVQPALVADRSGARMFSYNPRISILMNRLQAGNLLDRNGRILATSHQDLINTQRDSLLALNIPEEDINAMFYKRQDRYYPFGAQMFFWTGDANTNIFNGASNGYFAEYREAAEMRGFPIPKNSFSVSATRYHEQRFLPETSTEMSVEKKDYSALAPLLLAGINSTAVDSFKNKNRDVHLTLDAALQTRIQQSLQSDDSLVNNRVSVVVMEDKTGDVLASANYPLPQVNDWDMLNLTPQQQNALPGWITDNDIGFTIASQPGSTAKLVTALAAFNKLGLAASKKIIKVYPADLIRTKGYEPDEAGNINIERAIVRSNNSFFIRLANESQLQEYMGDLYLKSGMFLHGVGGYYYDYDMNNKKQQEEWKQLWRKTEFASLKSYNPSNIKRTRGKGISGMAWGQGELIATPASVARIASGIANNGTMMQSRYVLKVSGQQTKLLPGIELASDSASKLMTKYMIEQSLPKVWHLGMSVAGKTGTPERIVKNERVNDGLYVFFAPNPKDSGHIVVCVRIESCQGSSIAVKLAGKHVVPILKEMGYIRGFGDEKKKPAKVVSNKQLAVNRNQPTANNQQ
ncbi:FtsW/RodA/SpoVE family cell cycle protein [Parafilimonas terrae]|uniref:Cell division protein FtsW, lipid II flippase n=1 Tax=Parafilimonas terrae TaxID=1465490 RepID=A0A1I5YA19_9BACT|nr:FtsW/RodA/SpoVE family cell cycle protein [Parafilimonas terrae]SFQ41013.1 cell division protein FtsW, lipid II flippase [Parafilimonas terrae]